MAQFALAAVGAYIAYKYLFGGSGLKKENIGVNFNNWRRPADLDRHTLRMIEGLFNTDELNLKEQDWSQATWAVDTVLGLLLKEIQKEAKKYEGLVIVDYIKQGSARDGLKVHKPDEFDVLLQFRIDRLKYELENLALPELAYIVVHSTLQQLQKSHPTLHKKDVFTESNGIVRINTMNLQEKVFKSIIATASARLPKTVSGGRGIGNFEFQINTRTNPPSVNIAIIITQPPGSRGTLPSLIDVDIVPGLLLGLDKVPDPTSGRSKMDCPRYAVFKWFTENHKSASRYNAMQDLLWRVCSSGYEKQVIDIAHGKNYQPHIIVALRLLKLFFSKERKSNPYQQVLTVLRSYHLKHLAFYCILYLRVLHKEKISGVKEAVAYLFRFMEVCLEERKLPHFFHNNPNLARMFPDYPCKTTGMKYNLFDRKSDESLNQASRSIHWLKIQLSTVMDSSKVKENIVREFRAFLQTGIYF